MYVSFLLLSAATVAVTQYFVLNVSIVRWLKPLFILYDSINIMLKYTLYYRTDYLIGRGENNSNLLLITFFKRAILKVV